MARDNGSGGVQLHMHVADEATSMFPLSSVVKRFRGNVSGLLARANLIHADLAISDQLMEPCKVDPVCPVDMPHSLQLSRPHYFHGAFIVFEDLELALPGQHHFKESQERKPFGSHAMFCGD